MEHPPSEGFFRCTAVWLTKWAYPFGGGESAFYECMRLASGMGIRVYWLSFSTADNEPHARLRTIPLRHGNPQSRMVHVPGGIAAAESWLRMIRPAFAHQQGAGKPEFLRACRAAGVPMVSAFHFWHDAIAMSPRTLNVDMERHISEHRPDPQFESIWAGSAAVYVASEFMRDIITRVTGRTVATIVHPVSGRDCLVPSAECQAETAGALQVSGYEAFFRADRADFSGCYADPRARPCIAMINVHSMKGGEVLLKMIDALPHISFLAVRTEHNSEQLDARLSAAIATRNRCPGSAPSIMVERVSDVRRVYALARLVVVASVVDETFCRVAAEAMQNRIPMLTTARGNIRNIVGVGASGHSPCAVVLDGSDTAAWSREADDLLSARGEPAYRRMQSAAAARHEALFSEEVSMCQFQAVLADTHASIRSRQMVMFYTPWCDQGLGIQSRAYCRMLESRGIRTCVFAFAPYWKADATRNQSDGQEWVHPRVHYSANNREQTTDAELTSFVRLHGVTACVIPETCWFRVFQVARLMRDLCVRCYAVPNFEIVRRDEIHKHRYFYRILCNNLACERAFRSHGFAPPALVQVGFSMPVPALRNTKVPYTPTPNAPRPVRFLFVGGLNAFSRKQVVQVVTAFSDAWAQRERRNDVPAISLTVCVQSTEGKTLKEGPGIAIVARHMSYAEVMDMYATHDAVIQVSRHEGLGLGFFEALSMGCPVVTLDTAPHNEIVLAGVNGALVPCTFEPMNDNNDGLVRSAVFVPSDLALAILDVAVALPNLLTSTRADYDVRLNYDAFASRFADAVCF